MKAPLIFTATTVLALTLGAQAEARTSTASEYRGYQACLEASAGNLNGLVTDRTYLLNEQDGQRTYYINATAWESGERVSVALRCETNRGGRVLSTAEPAYARYVPAGDTVQIARQ